MATLRQCKARGCDDHGFWAGDKQSKLCMIACETSDTQLDCVAVVKGATAVLKDCDMLRSRTGSGLVIKHTGSCVDAKHCTFTGNAECGVYAVTRGTLKARSCRSSDNSKGPGTHYGFEVSDGGRLELADCTSDGLPFAMNVAECG